MRFSNNKTGSTSVKFFTHAIKTYANTGDMKGKL